MDLGFGGEIGQGLSRLFAGAAQAVAQSRGLGDGGREVLPVRMSLELFGGVPRIQRHDA